MFPLASPLSVIVPIHNRADLAERAFAALARWTIPVEVVVVDDGSSDPGVERLRRQESDRRGPRVAWLHNEEAKGFSAAINRGIERATGNFLLLLNSDAEVSAGSDRALLAGLAALDGKGAVAARLLYPDGRAQWSGGRFPTLPWLFALASGLGRHARLRTRTGAPSGFAGGPVDWAPAAALAFSRETWRAVGPFDETYRHYAQDLDFCTRLGAAGLPVRVLADWTVLHHLGGSLKSLEPLESLESLVPATSGGSGGPGRTGSDAARRGGGSAGYDGQRLDLLWGDLLHWAELHRGAAWTARARRRLILGGRLRQLMLLSRSDSAEARAVASALHALRTR
ncbi:MAG: glycosyltransferase family 2 protein [Thermoanaerobaculia bacterium]